MSTTQSQVAPSSTAPSPSTTSSAASSLNNTSTLLFGFLVSALSVFAIFTVSATIWNRLVSRRRAIDAMLAINPPRYTQRVYRPMMWDVWAMPDKQLPPWLDVKPVAAQKCEKCGPSTSPRTRQTEQFWRHRLLERLPPEITYLFNQPIPQTSSVPRDTDISSQVELSDGSDIQISLLISMPHAPQSTQEGNRERRCRLHEMVFATTNVLYHDPAPL